MSKIKVYRIEDAKGVGPYHGDSSWIIHEHNVKSGQPMPCYDSMSGVNYHHIYGFKSLKQLRDWFWRKRENKALVSLGFKLAVYEVDKSTVIHGKKQLAFENHRAKRVKSLKLETVLKQAA